jgi:hypothetical protein
MLGLLAVAGACEGDFEELPKPRTVRVSEGPVVMVGRNLTTCSHQPVGGSPDRWCAFARPGFGGAADLWVVNIKRALAGSVTCDGSSPHCLRLTDALWTGQSLSAPAHPTGHAFSGDTLAFYARPTGANPTGYEGPVQAWRAGTAAPQVVTSERGRACIGHDRSPGLICVDRQTPGRDIQFDFLAGSLGAQPDQPLPRIETIRPISEDGDLLWQVAFSPAGDYLAFSDQVPEGSKMERLRIVAAAELGKAEPRELLRDVAHWQFSPDGRQLFFLRGFNYGQGDRVSGTLAVVDFPSGANLRELQPGVGRYAVHGDAGGPTRFVSLYQEMSGLTGRFSILADLARPDQLTSIASDVEDAVVSPDLRYSLLFAGDEDGDLTTFVARNDGSGRCRVGAHGGRGVYAPTFLSKPERVLWAEDAAENSLLSEGWVGDPASCQPGQQFSTRLALYEPTGAGLVWGDLEDGPRTLTLQYARFTGATLDLDKREELARTIDPRVAVVDSRYVLYTVSRGTPEQTGLFLHGPLP